MDTEEKKVIEEFHAKGLTEQLFSKEEIRKSKTPDFRFLKNGELSVFCEVKTISQDDWLDVTHQILIVRGSRIGIVRFLRDSRALTVFWRNFCSVRRQFGKERLLLCGVLLF